jgi:hypothetical protein
LHVLPRRLPVALPPQSLYRQGWYQDYGLRKTPVLGAISHHSWACDQ